MSTQKKITKGKNRVTHPINDAIELLDAISLIRAGMDKLTIELQKPQFHALAYAIGPFIQQNSNNLLAVLGIMQMLLDTKKIEAVTNIYGATANGAFMSPPPPPKPIYCHNAQSGYSACYKQCEMCEKESEPITGK